MQDGGLFKLNPSTGGRHQVLFHTTSSPGSFHSLFCPGLFAPLP